MGNWKLKQTGTAGTYIYNNNDCQMFLGVENKFQKNNLSLGVFTGLSNNGPNNPALLVDLKENYKYDKRGIFSNNVRIRNNFSDGSNSTQIRISPLTVTVPVGKTTTAYINPHLVGKYNYNTKNWTQGAGVFTGIEQKIGNASIALEGQRYNIQDWGKNKGNWGVNIIYTQTF